MATHVEIEKCSDVLEIVHGVKSRIGLYRGQDVAGKVQLEPKLARIAREMKLERTRDYEDEILEQFKRQATPYVDLRHDSPELRWLCLARHYGLPTRLLDWTTNPFVALWFAVEQREQNDSRGSYLHIFEVDDDDLEQNPDFASASSIDRDGLVKAFRPFHIDKRIAAQAGWFTIHPYEEDVNSYTNVSKRSIRGKLSNHRVSNDSAQNIREELLKMGISRATLFPDLDGISQAIEMDLRLKRIHIAALHDNGH